MNIIEILYLAGISIAAIISANNGPGMRPHKVTMCISYEEDFKKTEDIWSDYVDIYRERHPGSTCGPCDGIEVDCQEQIDGVSLD